MSDRIQQGVFFRPGEQPPRHFAIVFLRVQAGAGTDKVKDVLLRLVFLYRELQAGHVPDLAPRTVPAGDLVFLIGYGPRMFSVQGVTKAIPEPLGTGRFPAAVAGAPILLGAGIRYAPNLTDNPADADIVVQFHASTPLAVTRAVVETWKVLFDVERATGTTALRISQSYSGFSREDGRSWIDFHDGLSNLRSSERLKAIEIKRRALPHPDQWTEEGTYMVFLRLPLNLRTWRSAPRAAQEVIVGREKLGGCPLTGLDPSGGPIVAEGCPVNGTGEVFEPGNEDFREAQRPEGPLTMSHIHRANHKRENVVDPESRRIFRQGYEFFQGADAAGDMSVGLNFVSFQDHPARTTFMLKQPGWLGRTNFGGDPNNQPPGFNELLRVDAAGVFVVPPRDNHPDFPGAELFS